MSRVIHALTGAATRRPLLVLVLVGALALAGGLLALGLPTSAGTSTLVDRGSTDYQATQSLYRHFGQDSVEVLVQGSLRNTLLTSDLERLIGLEGCLSGKLPANLLAREGGADGPCGRLTRSHDVKVVVGPGSFVNEAVGELQDQFTSQVSQTTTLENQASAAAYSAARARGLSAAGARRAATAARQAVAQQFVQSLVRLGVDYGLTTFPYINDPDTVSKIVFDPLDPVGTPKERLAYILPNANAALISVRLQPGLSESRQSAAISSIRRAVAMPQWRLGHGQRSFVTGVPVVVSDLSGSITASIERLLVGALLVMGATLALVFRRRLALLPLLLAGAAAALTFGGLALGGGSLTMASIGVLPVLVGLGVDYAIQFQSRVGEVTGERERAAEVRRAAALGGPTILTAGAATAGGFLALALSPVPMVRSFGLLLVAGVIVALLCAFTAGAAALTLAGRSVRGPRALRAIGPAWRGAGDLVFESAPLRWTRRRGPQVGAAALALSVRRPGRVLAVAVLLAALGWGLDTQTRVETDIQKLVPSSLPAVRNLDALERVTGVGGEIDVTVSSSDLTRPQAVRWMASYQSAMDRRFGYTPTRGCGHAELCPAFSLTDLFPGGTAGLTQQDIRSLLDLIPPYFSQGVISPDRRTANLSFGIRLLPLARQSQIVAALRRSLRPPRGVSAHLAGISVLAADAESQIAPAWRRLLTLGAGLAAVAIVLLAALRRPRRALVPLVPIALATGWSALVLFAIRIPLNPMSVTLGALVIAISTEFSVLLSERYRQERQAGSAPTAALERAYRSTGAAVLASGATAIAGFAVLVLSDIRMLRGFGAVTVVDLTVSLLGVLLVLPAVLLLAEGRAPVAVPWGPRRRRRGMAGARSPRAHHGPA